MNNKYHSRHGFVDLCVKHKYNVCNMSEKTAGTEAKKVTSWGRKMPGSKRKVVILLLAVFVSLAGYFGYQVYQDSKKPVVKEYKFTEEELKNIVNTIKNDPKAVQKSEAQVPSKSQEQLAEERRNAKKDKQQ